MPNPTRTLSISINNAFSDQLTQATQFREAAYNLKQTLTGGGWTVARSNNGTTASGADNWTAASALGLGTAGTGAWWAGISPAGWLDSSLTCSICISIKATGANPQAFQVRINAGTYSGGTTTTLPTASGAESTALSWNICPWSSVLTGYWASWRSSRGDVMFGVKQGASSSFRNWFMLYSNVDNNGNGSGSRRMGVYAHDTAGDDIVSSNFTNNGNWRGFDSGGTVANVPPNFESEAWRSASSWTNGRDVFSSDMDSTIGFWVNNASGRYLGTAIDLYAAPGNAVFGDLDDTESAQTQRRTCIGDLWAYAPTASLPFI